MNKKVQTSPRASNSEAITNPARIARLLQKMSKHFTPLSVRIPGHDELFTSCTVGVDKPYLLLDELMPTTGHSLLLKQRTLKVSGKLDGVDIRFTTSLERVDEKDNVITYYVSLPQQLEYKQRRQAFRVHIPMSKKLHVVIDHADGSVIEGVLYDLSHGGTGTIVSDIDTEVEPGLICECAFELPNNEWLNCSVELRYSKTVGSKNRQHIGARFIDLFPTQTRLIGRCISELEREVIRKRASL